MLTGRVLLEHVRTEMSAWVKGAAVEHTHRRGLIDEREWVERRAFRVNVGRVVLAPPDLDGAGPGDHVLYPQHSAHHPLWDVHEQVVSDYEAGLRSDKPPAPEAWRLGKTDAEALAALLGMDGTRLIVIPTSKVLCVLPDGAPKPGEVR